jgi:hypothetical protein
MAFLGPPPKIFDSDPLLGIAVYAATRDDALGSQMMQNADEAAWLRFFLHRLLAALRSAKVPKTTAILRELIQEIENRLVRSKSAERARTPTNPMFILMALFKNRALLLTNSDHTVYRSIGRRRA